MSSRAVFCAVVLSACGSGAAPPSPSAAPPPANAVVPSACAALDLFPAADAMQVEHHPCREWIEATHGRVVRTGMSFSGTATTGARGAGLLVTCQHCTGAAEEPLVDPEGDPPPAFQASVPASSAQLRAGSAEDDRTSRFYFARRLFAPVPPHSAFDAGGRMTGIHPRHDFVVATISGNLIRLVGHLGAMAPPKVTDAAVTLDDPRGVAASSQAIAEALPGASVLLLGYPRELPDRAFGGQLVASVGEVLADDVARDRLSRADPDEAAIPYDPEVELLVAARAVSGMSGGGVFDESGRFVGVMVRATLEPVDGAYLARAVRASFVVAELNAALAAAPATLRERVLPFFPPNLIERDSPER